VPPSMGWCLDCPRNPVKNVGPLEQVTNLKYDPAQLDRSAFYQNLLGKGIAPAEIAQSIDPSRSAANLADLVSLAEGRYGKQVTQLEVGTQLKKHWQVQPPENCTACHR
jgi:hypothetical protein